MHAFGKTSHRGDERHELFGAVAVSVLVVVAVEAVVVVAVAAVRGRLSGRRAMRYADHALCRSCHPPAHKPFGELGSMP